jgi:hypothetical protein
MTESASPKPGVPPVLVVGNHTISPELFRMGYPEGGGPCTCSSTCCEGGVYLDVRERDRIMEYRDLIKRHMDETQNRDERSWFEPEELPDSDFPSGRCAGTEVHRDRCAFQDKFGRCSIQVATTEEGLGRWFLKPLYCILFPIEVSNGVVGHDDMLQDQRACCTVSKSFHTPVYQACREELVHLLGEEGYEAIDAHFRTHYAQQQVSV